MIGLSPIIDAKDFCLRLNFSEYVIRAEPWNSIIRVTLLHPKYPPKLIDNKIINIVFKPYDVLLRNNLATIFSTLQMVSIFVDDLKIVNYFNDWISELIKSSRIKVLGYWKFPSILCVVCDKCVVELTQWQRINTHLQNNLLTFTSFEPTSVRSSQLSKRASENYIRSIQLRNPKLPKSLNVVYHVLELLNECEKVGGLTKGKNIGVRSFEKILASKYSQAWLSIMQNYTTALDDSRACVNGEITEINLQKHYMPDVIMAPSLHEKSDLSTLLSRREGYLVTIC